MGSISNYVILGGVKALIVTADGRKLLSASSEGKIKAYVINNGDGFDEIKLDCGRE